MTTPVLPSGGERSSPQMPSLRAARRVLAGTGLFRRTWFFGMLLLLENGCGEPRGTADQVRKAITAAEVLDQSPSVVQDRLRRLVLPHGERLWVGEFVPDRRVIPAQVRDQHMR